MRTHCDMVAEELRMRQMLTGDDPTQVLKFVWPRAGGYEITNSAQQEV